MDRQAVTGTSREGPSWNCYNERSAPGWPSDPGQVLSPSGSDPLPHSHGYGEPQAVVSESTQNTPADGLGGSLPGALLQLNHTRYRPKVSPPRGHHILKEALRALSKRVYPSGSKCELNIYSLRRPSSAVRQTKQYRKAEFPNTPAEESRPKSGPCMVKTLSRSLRLQPPRETLPNSQSEAAF